MKNKKKKEEVVTFVFDPQLDPKKTFQNFIEGENNKLARTIGLSIAENPGHATCNPCFIYGLNGSGKTHLINAIGISCKEKDSQKQVLYVTAKEFQRQFTYSVCQNTMNEFINYYQSIDVLIVDDIQEWGNSPKTLETFVQIFSHLLRCDKQVVLASNHAPVKLQGFKKKIMNRFVSGLVLEMEKPTKQLCVDILNAKCEQYELKISAEVIEYISKAVDGSVCNLEGVVKTLRAYSSVNNTNIDMDLSKHIISQSIKLG